MVDPITVDAGGIEGSGGSAFLVCARRREVGNGWSKRVHPEEWLVRRRHNERGS
jgi:hypothetical protein